MINYADLDAHLRRDREEHADYLRRARAAYLAGVPLDHPDDEPAPRGIPGWQEHWDEIAAIEADDSLGASDKFALQQMASADRYHVERAFIRAL